MQNGRQTLGNPTSKCSARGRGFGEEPKIEWPNEAVRKPKEKGVVRKEGKNLSEKEWSNRLKGRRDDNRFKQKSRY